MEFRTPIHIEPFDFRISHASRGLLAGSCFVEHIGRMLRRYKMPAEVNPFGILFNPASIAAMLRRLSTGEHYRADDLIRSGDRWASLDHHGSLSSPDKALALDAINAAVDRGAGAMRVADYAIVTLGTAWVYETRSDGRIVGNCHRLPAAEFTRRRLTAEEIADQLGSCFENELQGKRVILTVSPIRHLGDGMAENALSKATLIVAVHELTAKYPSCRYFPAFEIMMDDLRDYRFYDRDMAHPSETAVEYIWGQFCRTAIDASSLGLFREIDVLLRAEGHRPSDSCSDAHRDFRQRHAALAHKLQEQYSSLDFSREINFFES